MSNARLHLAARLDVRRSYSASQPKKAFSVMALSVPKSISPGLRAIAELQDSSVERLTTALAEVPPAAVADKLASEVSGRLGEPQITDLLQIMRALVNLSTGRALCEMTVPQFVSEVCDGLKGDREFSDFTSETMGRLRERLERFLRLDGPLAITSKALGVLTDHEHIFVGARILTDVRSVFKDNVEEPPAGAVIVHMLGVHYHEGHSHKEIFFALDTQDLKQLRESIDRASKKEEALKEMLSRAGVQYLGVE
jgi:hypothetical protein